MELCPCRCTRVRGDGWPRGGYSVDSSLAPSPLPQPPGPRLLLQPRCAHTHAHASLHTHLRPPPNPPFPALVLTWLREGLPYPSVWPHEPSHTQPSETPVSGSPAPISPPLCSLRAGLDHVFAVSSLRGSAHSQTGVAARPRASAGQQGREKVISAKASASTGTLRGGRTHR